MRVTLSLAVLFCLTAGQLVRAQDATWNLNPASGDWNTAANWTPAEVPVTTATFGVSNQTAISFSGSSVGISEIVFNPGASAYTFMLSGAHSLSLQGFGIANNSGVAQNFTAANGAVIYFLNSSDAGDSTSLTVKASAASGAGAGTIVFADNSSGGNATIVSEGSAVANADGGFLVITAGATASMANITIEGGQEAEDQGGRCEFSDKAKADQSVITCAGATFAGAGGGTLTFDKTSNADRSTLIASGGANGGAGGSIHFEGGSKGGSARVAVSGNASLDLTAHSSAPVTLGSLEGDGLVTLGQKQLSVGANNLSTTFAGAIQGTGALTKLGSGTLTLSSANTYSGGTTVSMGVLKVINQTGSATGTGDVAISAGTIGGKGIIAGAVTVGTGSGTGATLQPSVGLSQTVKLTIQNSLTFRADSTYTYKLSTQKANADQVVANSVVIESSAQFNFTALANKRLAPGLRFTAISNTGAAAISGTFANLADGAVLVAGPNKFQASYSGGDGNDLTLTVVP